MFKNHQIIYFIPFSDLSIHGNQGRIKTEVEEGAIDDVQIPLVLSFLVLMITIVSILMVSEFLVRIYRFPF